MPQVTAQEHAKCAHIVAKRLADFLDKGGAKAHRRRRNAVPFEQRLSRRHQLARHLRRLLVRGRGDALAELLAGEDGPRDRRALEQPLQPAEAIAVPRPLLARLEQRPMGQAEEF